MSQVVNTTVPKDCRSVLYMPATKARVLQKGASLPADAIVIDLEDSVAPDAKSDARHNAVQCLQTLDYGYRKRALRVNVASTEWYSEDVLAAIAGKVDAIVLPKVENASDVMALATALDNHTSANNIAIWIMIESPLAVLNIKEIASCCLHSSRLQAMILGTNDMARAANMQVSKNRTFLLPWLMQVVGAAHAYSLAIWDSVYNDFKDLEGLSAECIEAVSMGMHGKTLIHPAQLEMCNKLFSPSPQEIERARGIVQAYAENNDAGVLQINGEMVERLHLDMAQQLLNRAERLTHRANNI